MKQAEVLKVLAVDLGTSEVDQINHLLKDKNYQPVRYRIASKKLGHSGFTGLIKSLTEEGVKVFGINKVSLIRYADMEAFVKAKPRAERKVYAQPAAEEPAEKSKPKLKPKPQAEVPERSRPSAAGSRFIPKK